MCPASRREATSAAATATAAGSHTPRQPREGTKGAAVLALLRRPEGASGPQLVEATG